jgi:Regulators of stationary/sporulation gene expression
MKSTGMVREVDQLGRIVLPNELRTVLDIKVRDPLAFYQDENYL